MHTLIVVAHPNPGSLSHHLAKELRDDLTRLSSGASAEVVDLAAEGFDPRFTARDHTAYCDGGGYPADVVAEQARIERADNLVLVFPVYWWSMPALLKGWVDRVFSNGWAFSYGPATGSTPMMDRLTMHLVPIASGDAEGYTRHGYESSLRNQIEHGIIQYCGARLGTTTFVFDSETRSPDSFAPLVRAAADAIIATGLGTVDPLQSALVPE